MNWREILSQSNDLEINTDLLVCADWCDENGRENAAMKLREWAKGDIVMIDEEPFRYYRNKRGTCIDLHSLFNRKLFIVIQFPRSYPGGVDPATGVYYEPDEVPGCVYQSGFFHSTHHRLTEESILDIVRSIRRGIK